MSKVKKAIMSAFGSGEKVHPVGGAGDAGARAEQAVRKGEEGQAGSPGLQAGEGGEVNVSAQGSRDSESIARSLDSASSGEQQPASLAGDAAPTSACAKPPPQTAKAGKGTSVFKGVAQHKVTKRWESHIWENKKQIYLGSFAAEEEAAAAYDKAAIFLRKDPACLNFPVESYNADEMRTIMAMTKEKLFARLRRGSNGFSRGKTKFRGVSFRSHTGRWEARISGVEHNKYTYLGTYDSPEEAAVAYDRAAIALKGRQAVTNFDITDYEAELGHLTSMHPSMLGKDSLATKVAVRQGKEQYYADILAKGKKPGRVAAPPLPTPAAAKPWQHRTGSRHAEARAVPRSEDRRGIHRQRAFNFVGAGGGFDLGAVPDVTARKARPSKRDRSFNSDLVMQQTFAPVAKIVGGPYHTAAGLPEYSCSLAQGAVAQQSSHSDQTHGLGLGSGSAAAGNGEMTRSLVRGMVHPMSSSMDVPVSSFLCKHGAGEPPMWDVQGARQVGPMQALLREEERYHFSSLPGASDSGAWAEEAYQDTVSSYGLDEHEFDVYIDKLLRQGDRGAPPREGHPATPRAAQLKPNHSIEENLSAFLSNISLNDIPDVLDNDLDEGALQDIEPNQFL